MSAPAIPKRLPVVLEDRILFWMQQSHCSNFGLIAKFQGHVDFDRLKKALRLCLDAEPILGCRFVNRPGRQYWERLDNLDDLELCSLVTKFEYEGHPAQYLDMQPGIDAQTGPQVRAYLLRAKSDILCMRVNHVAADGGGTKDLAYLLSHIYNRLKHDPDYAPAPNLENRGLKQVFRNFSPMDYLRIARRGFRDTMGFASGRTRRDHPLIIREPEGFTMFTRVIGPRRFAGAKAYGKARGATLNDIMATAMLRSFYSVITPDPRAYLRMVTTADLRRYIPGGQAGAVCNLSGFSYINIGRGAPKTFDALLKIVSSEFAALKSDYIGLGSIPFTAAVFKTLPFSLGLWIHDRLGNLQKRQTATTGDVALLFTNAGTIEPERFTFEGATVSWAAVITTRATPPVLAVCISGFRDKLTITAGFCENTISRSKVQQLLDQVDREIRDLAK